MNGAVALIDQAAALPAGLRVPVRSETTREVVEGDSHAVEEIHFDVVS